MSVSMVSAMSLKPVQALKIRVKQPRATVAKRNMTTCALPAMVAPMVAPALEAVAAAGTMYALMSINEYITHRYYQHDEISKIAFIKKARKENKGLANLLDGGGHIEHHAETLDDMSLRKDEKWKKTPMYARLNDSMNEWRGTAFEWNVSAMMCGQMAPQVYPVFMGLFGWNFVTTTAYFLASMVLHALVWNALHPNMHGLHDIKTGRGAPSSVLKWMRGSSYFTYLYENHQGHHVSGGRTNYNVACPGVDLVLGTYETKDVWTATMLEKAVNASKGSADLGSSEIDAETVLA